MGEILTLQRVGGHPALDFANTAGWHASAERIEHLHTYADLLEWGGAAGTISPSDGTRLGREAARHPRRAAAALAQAVVLRETVYRIFARLAQKHHAEGADLDSLHRARMQALDAATLVSAGDRYSLRWPEHSVELLRPVYPVAIAAMELLESGQLTRLRQCQNHPCGWLFLDRSKNGTRRWCSSAECGNATRVRRFRSRQD